jgi:hypothetical protein
VTRFKRLHRGAQKGNAANYWSLSEPHYEQNLSANPKRTAKFFVLIFDAERPDSFNKSFSPSENFQKNIATHWSLKTRRMKYLRRQGARANLLKILPRSASRRRPRPHPRFFKGSEDEGRERGGL